MNLFGSAFYFSSVFDFVYCKGYCWSHSKRFTGFILTCSLVSLKQVLLVLFYQVSLVLFY